MENNTFLGHWKLANGLELPDDFENNKPFGFVYKITNKSNDKFYWGKKQMICVKKLPPLKGKVRKRKVSKETDWKIYTSSSPNVNKDIEILGIDNFIFEIFDWCDSKSHCAYVEAKRQFADDVLLNEQSYNGIINLRISTVKINKI